MPLPLTDMEVRNAKAKNKAYKLFDGRGLFLWVQPNGGKWWRYKYHYSGEKLLAIGCYPDVSLAQARNAHADARKILAAGQDPNEIKKAVKRQARIGQNNTFEAIAREWHKQHIHEWKAHYAADVLSRLEINIFPKLGRRPITALTAPEILEALRVMEKAGKLDLAQRMMQTCGQVFRYAITTSRAQYNPVPDLRGALKSPVVKHHAYINAEELPDYLCKLHEYEGEPITRLALKMLLLTFVRTSELCGAEWSEVNLGKAEWRIPSERMKMKGLHIVPLSLQTITILDELKQHSGNRQFIFPGQFKPTKCMSNNAMLFALYRMGYHSRATGHGFRSTASTILNEHGFAPDVIERQLAHCEGNKVRAAYNHAEYLPERRKMMQWWGDYLNNIHDGLLTQA